MYTASLVIHYLIKETPMKKFIFAVLLTAIAFTTVHALSWSQMTAAVDNQPVLKSAKHEVSAYGFNFRQYTWIDPAGRICTTAITDGKALGLSCEFPPANFDYTSIQNKLK